MDMFFNSVKRGVIGLNITEEEIKAAKKAHAEYNRQYRAKNPEKMREIRIRYWAKRAAKNAAAKEERTGNE